MSPTPSQLIPRNTIPLSEHSTRHPSGNILPLLTSPPKFNHERHGSTCGAHSGLQPLAVRCSDHTTYLGKDTYSNPWTPSLFFEICQASSGERPGKASTKFLQTDETTLSDCERMARSVWNVPFVYLPFIPNQFCSLRSTGMRRG